VEVSKTARASGLLAEHADVNEDPEDKPWAKLVEVFDAKGADGGVEFMPDEELWGIVRGLRERYIIDKLPGLPPKARSLAGRKGEA
jgi:hypothetical protein